MRCQRCSIPILHGIAFARSTQCDAACTQPASLPEVFSCVVSHSSCRCCYLLAAPSPHSPPSSPPCTAWSTIPSTGPSPARRSPCKPPIPPSLLHATTNADGDVRTARRRPSAFTRSKSPLPASPPYASRSPSPPAPTLSCTFRSPSARGHSNRSWSKAATQRLRHRFRHAHHAHHRARHRRNPRRRPHHRHGDDHRLRARRLHDPRHAAHARRPPDQLAHRRRRHPQHQDRLQRRPADRSQGHRLARNPARQLRRRRGRPHLRRLQRPAPQRLRAQPRRRTAALRRQPLHRRSPALARRPLQQDRLVRQPHRLPLQLRPGHAGRRTSTTTPPTPRAALSRSSATRPPKDQLRLDAPVPPGLLPGSLRPQPQRLRMHLRLLLLLRPARRRRPSATPSSSPTGCTPSRPRRCSPFAPFYHFNQANYDSPPNRPSRRHHLAPDLELRRRPGRRRASTSARNSFSAGLYSFYQAENDLFGVMVNDGSRALPAQHAPPTPTPAWSSSTSPIICAWASYVTLLGGERFSIYRAGLERVRDLSAHRRNRRDPPAALGPARLLRPLLPARADGDRLQRPCSTTPASLPTRRKRLHARCPPSATKSTSSASRFPTGAGCSTSTPSKTASTTSSITPTSASPTCTSPSPSMARWCAPGR